jgi:hypothetical protein
LEKNVKDLEVTILICGSLTRLLQSNPIIIFRTLHSAGALLFAPAVISKYIENPNAERAATALITLMVDLIFVCLLKFSGNYDHR